MTPGGFLVFKYLITAALVVGVSEAAKRSERLGGLIAALPLVTVLTLIWLYAESQPSERIANHAFYTFWYVLPTLPMFLVFPRLMARYGFWPTMGLSLMITLISFAALASVVRRFGINLT